MKHEGGGIRLMVLLLLVAAGIWFFLGRHSHGPTRPFTVGQGVSAHQLANDLHAQGFIWHPMSFLLWVRWYGAEHIRPGIYNLSTQESGREILKKFFHGPPLVRITFPEGWTSRQMGALLETKNICSADAFRQAVDMQKREGFLFPDTYFFPQGANVTDVIERLVHQFHQKEPRDIVQQAKALKLTYVQIVTLASLVEKEARVPKERPLIAGVYLNRLKKHMRLEADPTVQYALGEWKSRLTYKDLDVRSPYNTYRHTGLPPGPICNPGAASLEAAAHPEPTDALFFVAEGGGTHRFSKTYQEHMAVQKQMQRSK